MDHRFFESRAIVIRCYRSSLCRIISAHSALVILVALGFVSYALLELVASTILPFIVVPMFYKLKPYSDTMQRDQLLRMAQKAGEKTSNESCWQTRALVQEKQHVLYGVRWDQNDGALR